MGENAVAVRTEVCRPLEFLGLKLDAQANAHPKLDQDIATSDSRVRIIVIPDRKTPASVYERSAFHGVICPTIEEQEAFLARFPNSHLTIAGEGPMLAELRALATALVLHFVLGGSP